MRTSVLLLHIHIIISDFMKNTVACSTIATPASSSSSEIWRAAKVIMSGLIDAGATSLSINVSNLQKPKLKTWGLSCRSCPKTRSSQHSILLSIKSNHVTYWALHSPSHPIEALQKAGLCMRWRQHWSLKSEKIQWPPILLSFSMLHW